MKAPSKLGPHRPLFTWAILSNPGPYYSHRVTEPSQQGASRGTGWPTEARAVVVLQMQ